jgi:hypothetical protein
MVFAAARSYFFHEKLCDLPEGLHFSHPPPTLWLIIFRSAIFCGEQSRKVAIALIRQRFVRIWFTHSQRRQRFSNIKYYNILTTSGIAV